MFRDVESDAKPKEAQVWHLVKEAVDLEKEFFDSVIQPLFCHCSTSPTIRGYIDNEGESLLEELGLTGVGFNFSSSHPRWDATFGIRVISDLEVEKANPTAWGGSW